MNGSSPRHAAPREVGDRRGGAAGPFPNGDLHTPPPPPPRHLSRPSPDSALGTTSPTYPLLLQIPCQATAAPAGSGRRKDSLSSSSAPTTALPTVSGGGCRGGSCAAQRLAWGMGASERGGGYSESNGDRRRRSRETRALVPLWRSGQVVRLRGTRLLSRPWRGAEAGPVRGGGGEFRPSFLRRNHRDLRAPLAGLLEDEWEQWASRPALLDERPHLAFACLLPVTSRPLQSE
ncbi:phenazine biosynthesis-like domain-containing protein isoform X4 [Myotis myotis]|uniref:phenazine biosynthesis-like domain-containing protein isoform X4 n=1 Tax=Myotis myotis TaxID=51298 RepID=UPI00174DAF20|nr:phenazine biosynthesis-like domain-containing protein isoform X4 [Myotis myotis]